MRFFFFHIYSKIAGSRLVKTLLIIIIIKFAVFYGFLKGYLYPVHLKPKYENNEHRSEEVLKRLLNDTKSNFYVGKH
jgi:hypothetical protein